MFSYFEINNTSFEDFYMIFCGIEKCKPSYSYGPAIRSNYLIHFCLDGEGCYYIDNKKYIIKKGEGFLIKPNDLTFYKADDKNPWTYLWIGFNGTKSEHYLNKCNLINENLIFKFSDTKILESLVNDMMKHDKLNYSNELMVQGLFYIFFSHLAKEANNIYKSSKLSENNYVNKAIKYIENNYQNDITVNKIADYLSLNRSYLSLIFQKEINLSPQQFLVKYRITKAISMLTETDLLINNIAYSCGYSNPLSFSKSFKKITGLSPTEYREAKKIKPNENYKIYSKELKI